MRYLKNITIYVILLNILPFKIKPQNILNQKKNYLNLYQSEITIPTIGSPITSLHLYYLQIREQFKKKSKYEIQIKSFSENLDFKNRILYKVIYEIKNYENEYLQFIGICFYSLKFYKKKEIVKKFIQSDNLKQVMNVLGIDELSYVPSGESDYYKNEFFVKDPFKLFLNRGTMKKKNNNYKRKNNKKKAFNNNNVEDKNTDNFFIEKKENFLTENKPKDFSNKFNNKLEKKTYNFFENKKTGKNEEFENEFDKILKNEEDYFKEVYGNDKKINFKNSYNKQKNLTNFEKFFQDKIKSDDLAPVNRYNLQNFSNNEKSKNIQFLNKINSFNDKFLSKNEISLKKKKLQNLINQNGKTNKVIDSKKKLIKELKKKNSKEKK